MGTFDLAESLRRVACLIICLLVMFMAQEKQILRRAPVLIGLSWVVALAPRLCGMDVAQLCHVDALQVQDWTIARREGALVLRQDRQISERFFSDGESCHGVFEMLEFNFEAQHRLERPAPAPAS